MENEISFIYPGNIRPSQIVEDMSCKGNGEQILKGSEVIGYFQKNLIIVFKNAFGNGIHIPAYLKKI